MGLLIWNWAQKVWGLLGKKSRSYRIFFLCRILDLFWLRATGCTGCPDPDLFLFYQPSISAEIFGNLRELDSRVNVFRYDMNYNVESIKIYILTGLAYFNLDFIHIDTFNEIIRINCSNKNFGWIWQWISLCFWMLSTKLGFDVETQDAISLFYCYCYYVMFWVRLDYDTKRLLCLPREISWLCTAFSREVSSWWLFIVFLRGEFCITMV